MYLYTEQAGQAMNSKQRNKNRANAEKLAEAARQTRLAAHTCENCGERGGHWISTRGTSLEGMLTGQDDQEGFWTCPKFYGEDGKRLPEHTDGRWSQPADALWIAALT